MEELISQYNDLLEVIEDYNSKESKDFEEYDYIMDRKREFLLDDIGETLHKIFSSKKYGIQLGPYSVDTLLHYFDMYYRVHVADGSLHPEKIKEEDINLPVLLLGNESGFISKFDSTKMVDNMEYLKENFPELFYTLCYIRYNFIDSMIEYKGINMDSIYTKHIGLWNEERDF